MSHFSIFLFLIPNEWFDLRTINIHVNPLVKKLFVMKKILSYAIALFTFNAGAQTFTQIDINPEGPSYCSGFVELNGKVYMKAENIFNTNSGLWVSDGTVGGSQLVSDVWINLEASPLVPLNNSKLVFSGQAEESDNTYGAEPWVSDGTAAGTFMLKDINVGDEGSYPNFFTAFNGFLYFAALDTSVGIELWRTDGTTAGTVLVKDIDPNTYSGVHQSSNPNNFIVFKGKLYFSASSGQSGYELFSSDGTAEGTQLFIDLSPPANYDSNPKSFTIFNDKLFFVVNDYSHGYELWSTDGTVAGTSLLKDIARPGAHGPENLTELGGKMFFSVDDGINGNELWVTDGTAEGTHIVKDIYLSANSGSYPENLTAAGNKLFFFASDSIHGNELWVSDGTEQGTHLVKDIIPGTNGLSIDICLAYHDKFYFNGEEDWDLGKFYQSDGTEAGTKLCQPTGTTSINPAAIENFHAGTALNSIFMTALFSGGDRKLWRYEDGQSAMDDINRSEHPISIYPNPTSNDIEISINTRQDGSKIEHFNEIQIIDISGRIIDSKILSHAATIQTEQTGTIKLKTSNYPDGVYFVHLKMTENGMQKGVSSTVKLVVQH
jgi:ELWxxDGT repeat protein